MTSAREGLVDSRERLDEFRAIIKLAALKPEYEAKLRSIIRRASDAAPVDVLVKIGTVIAEGQEDYLRMRN